MSTTKTPATSPVREPVFAHGRPLASGIPLGGLGTGSVELMDTGRFRDWEIYNNYQWSGNPDEAAPEMWPEDSFFALRVKPVGRGANGAEGPPRVRLLYLDDEPINTLSPKKDNAFIYNFPFLKNVEGIAYSGHFPFARLAYEDATLPVRVSMEAFSPFIPHNAKDSGLPLAFFTFTVCNLSDTPLDASLAFTMRNCTGYERDELHLRHRVRREPGMRSVLMDAEGIDPTARTAGSTAIAVLGEEDELSQAVAWTVGRGGTEGRMQAWDLAGDEELAARETTGFSQVFHPFRDEGELTVPGDEWDRRIKRLREKPEPGTLQSHIHRIGWVWNASLARKTTIAPGKEERFTFLLAWHYPNHYHYRFDDVRLGHMYENWFADAADVIRYGFENHERLDRESRAFVDELYRGTLPEFFLASLNAQLTTLVKSTFWTADGDLAIWEGQACCQAISAGRTPWSTWVPLAFFPDLYVPMVSAIVASSLDVEDDEGEGPADTGHALVDLRKRRRSLRSRQRGSKADRLLAGRFGALGYTVDDVAKAGLIGEGGPKQVLLESQWSGDRGLLRELWPMLRTMVDEAIAADENDDGLPAGLSGLTYDHWFVPATNCYKCTMWLADVRAAIRIAEIMDDGDAAARYRVFLEKGMASFERLFWNDEYYRFCYDPKIDRYDEGCMADQVSGQLFCRMLGLDSVHDGRRIDAALDAVHRHNLIEEEGLINGSDPRGRDDWRYFAAAAGDGFNEARGGQWPTPWTGTEYYVAAVMASEGHWRQALDVVRNVWERHVRAGMIYNHLECGEHYFRALAVWAILPAVQGLVHDPAEKHLRFVPTDGADRHESLFIVPQAWGRLSVERTDETVRTRVAVTSGSLEVRSIRVPAVDEPAVVGATLNGTPLPSSWERRDEGVAVILERVVSIGPSDELGVHAGVADNETRSNR